MEYKRNFTLINRKFRELLFPTIAVSIAGNFAVLIDAFLISLILGSQYLAVIQSIQPIVLFISVIYWMIGLGGSILCSIAKADFNDEKANIIFTVSLISVVLIGTIITILVFLFPNTFSQVICNSSQLRPFVSQYLIMYIIGVPFMCYMACVAYFIKSYGFIKLQFWAFLISNIVNIICDIIFMKYLNLGIIGAGLATSIGFIISAIYITSYFFSPKKSVRIIKVKASIFLRHLVNICKSGFSSSSVNLYEGIRVIIINSLLILLIGTVGLEAFNMCCNILFLVMIFIFGTIQSIVPIVSVYFKEEDYNGVSYVCDKSMKVVVGFAIFFSLLFILFPEISLYLFNVKNPNSIPITLNAVRWFSVSFIGFAITNMYIFYAQSAQYTKLANFVSFLEGLLLPVTYSIILSQYLGADGIWIAFAISEFTTIVVIFIYSRYMARKTNNEISGFFLIKRNKDVSIFEYTINGNIDDALNLSKKVQETLSYSELSKTVGSAIEELLVNIIKLNDGVDLIDITIRDKKDSMIISIKYSGILFNPLECKHSENLLVLGRFADNIEYSQILELNNTEITLKTCDL